MAHKEISPKTSKLSLNRPNTEKKRTKSLLSVF